MNNKIRRWLPAILMMAIVFAFSSTPSSALPRFGLLDFLVKKTSHALAYAILGLCYLSAQAGQREKRRYWLAFLLAVLYSITDEFHQGFVSGRHPSPIDVGIDAFGAALSLLFTYFHEIRYKEKPEQSAG